MMKPARTAMQRKRLGDRRRRMLQHPPLPAEYGRGKEMKKESMIKILLDQMNEQQFRNYLDIISSYGMARFGISVVISNKNAEETT